MSENKKYNLDELLKKSPAEITHDEMMYVLENMDMQSLLDAAVKRQNEKFINITDEQKN
jgi:hypothetical protein